jgi:hypothetical protein
MSQLTVTLTIAIYEGLLIPPDSTTPSSSFPRSGWTALVKGLKRKAAEGPRPKPKKGTVPDNELVTCACQSFIDLAMACVPCVCNLSILIWC